MALKRKCPPSCSEDVFSLSSILLKCLLYMEP